MQRRGHGDRSLRERIEAGDVAPVYYLYGEDEYRREQALQHLLQALLPAEAWDLNLEQMHPGEGAVGSLLERSRTVPFLAARRVLLIRDADALSQQEQAELALYLADPSPSTCLVLSGTRLDPKSRLAAAVHQKGVVLRFNRSDARSKRETLQALAHARGKQITPEAVDLLIALSGDDLRLSVSGLEKAILFVGEQQEIAVPEIEDLIGETRARSIFQLTDAVGTRNLEMALRCLASLLDHGEEPLPILGMVARQIRLLARAKAMREQGASQPELTRTLGVHPGLAAVLAEQGASLQWGHLADAVRQLHTADLAIKTGRCAARDALHRLIWELCAA